ncbi:MAG: radical SAM protein [Candidatus Krumholzibacteriota bacterium]|nr:radical SAM protein [Candidatus Krumholzibacteriota bacterium]
MKERSLRLFSRLMKTLPYLILFVSSDCWNHCRHCWYNEKWKERHLKDAPLRFDELSKIADSIPSLRFLSLTGGEAFLRDDIVEITNLFAKKTKLHRYEIPSSGFEPERIASLTSAILDSNGQIPFRVDISIDGTEETHDIIRGRKGSHERALRTVNELLTLKKKYAWFDVGIITTLSRSNQNEIGRIGELAARINPGGEWMVNITRGEARDRDVEGVNLERYREAHLAIEESTTSGRHAGHSGHRWAKWLSAKNAVRRELILGILSGEKSVGLCAAGSLAGVIYSDGTVSPCETLTEPIGNIRDYDLDLAAAWNSPAAGRVRRSIADSRCSCTHECFLSVSLLVNPRYWPRIAWQRARLLRHRGNAR